jgi:hypothetical protein
LRKNSFTKNQIGNRAKDRPGKLGKFNRKIKAKLMKMWKSKNKKILTLSLTENGLKIMRRIN